MKCIFCKRDTAASTSEEHVVPQSLGNREHVLPPGVVCDACNNYFGREVEKPLLDTSYFRSLRYQARIPTKKGHPPRVFGVHAQTCAAVDIFPDMDGAGGSVAAAREKDETRFIRSLLSSPRTTLLVPVSTPPEHHLLSRFLLKVGIEALALRLLEVEGGIAEIVDKRALDPARDFARMGVGPTFWPYHMRQLYDLDHLFGDSTGPPYEVLHEWTFLYVGSQDLYFVIALFGVEYALSLGRADTGGYEEWLAVHGGKSPLYPRGLPRAGIP